MPQIKAPLFCQCGLLAAHAGACLPKRKVPNCENIMCAIHGIVENWRRDKESPAMSVSKIKLLLHDFTDTKEEKQC